MFGAYKGVAQQNALLDPPSLPDLGGATKKQNNSFQRAVKTAIGRLKNKSGDCAKLFGGANNAISTLENASRSYGTTPDIKGLKGVAAQTFEATNTVVTNSDGYFFEQFVYVMTPKGPNQMNWGVSTGLSGSDFQVFILLHELGHLTGAYGSHDQDGGNDAVSVANQLANNTVVLKDCFNQTFIPQP